jgi:hypothetical protein
MGISDSPQDLEFGSAVTCGSEPVLSLSAVKIISSKTNRGKMSLGFL